MTNKRVTTPSNALILDEIIQLIPGYDPVATAGDCWFDEKAAQDALDFFPKALTHVKGSLAKTPFILEPWEKAIIANLFGWKRPDGFRRYREAFVYVPRKNGKTALLAGIVNYVLFCDGEPGAEIYSAAADRDQALLVFSQASGMVRQNPTLDSHAQIYKAGKSIVVGSSSYKAISAEANTKHGYNTHLAVIDELHAQPNSDLVDVLITSTGARDQPLIVHITTADYDRESICNEKLDYASKVRDGVFDDSAFLPVIYEASKDDDWTDPDVWARVNPNLGVSLSLDYLKRECKRAQETPAYENTFKRLHLNIKTEQDVRWHGIETWDACKGEIPDLTGATCIAGLDLSTTTDITALVLLFRLDGLYYIEPHFWIPSDNAHERERRDRVPYVKWARQGLIEMTPGNVIDYAFVIERVNQLAVKYEIKEIAIDPYNATQLTQTLLSLGYPAIEVRQGYLSLSPAMKELERLILSKKIIHDGNKVMRWMFSNIAVKLDPTGNIKPDKSKVKEKIDGISALVTAMSRWVVIPEASASDSFEKMGLVIV